MAFSEITTQMFTIFLHVLLCRVLTQFPVSETVVQASLSLFTLDGWMDGWIMDGWSLAGGKKEESPCRR